MLIVGYAHWYYEYSLSSRRAPFVNRVLLDYELDALAPTEMHSYDAVEAEIFVSTRLGYLKVREPELWRRLLTDLAAAGKNGGMTIVVREYRRVMGRVLVRLAAYSDHATGEKTVFWVSVRGGKISP